MGAGAVLRAAIKMAPPGIEFGPRESGVAGLVDRKLDPVQFFSSMRFFLVVIKCETLSGIDVKNWDLK